MMWKRSVKPMTTVLLLPQLLLPQLLLLQVLVAPYPSVSRWQSCS